MRHFPTAYLTIFQNISVFLMMNIISINLIILLQLLISYIFYLFFFFRQISHCFIIFLQLSNESWCVSFKHSNIFLYSKKHPLLNLLTKKSNVLKSIDKLLIYYLNIYENKKNIPKKKKYNKKEIF
ncbi:MAG: hypothetical protein CMF69_11650 [Magnetovibrio sp.]|nr:hypothetical protein [Magnetovibrio sp.]